MSKLWIRILCVLLLVVLTGCSGERRKPDMDVTVPLSDKPILPAVKQTEGVAHTPVYATVFGDTVILATVPVEKWQDFEEPDCAIREISQGGQIRCGGEHEREVPITRVVILEALAPDSTREWFSGMDQLCLIEGLPMLDPEYITDMEDMFKDCISLLERPVWYQETE